MIPNTNPRLRALFNDDRVIDVKRDTAPIAAWDEKRRPLVATAPGETLRNLVPAEILDGFVGIIEINADEVL